MVESVVMGSWWGPIPEVSQTESSGNSRTIWSTLSTVGRLEVWYPMTVWIQ